MIERVINLELMRNPYNWATLWLMVVIAALALHIVFDRNVISTDEGAA